MRSNTPHAFPLVATRPSEAPWLRPPLRSSRWVQHFLATLIGFGFNEGQAVHSYKAFTSFLPGHLQLEAASQCTRIAPLLDGSESPATREGLSPYPTVVRLQDLLAEDRAERDFDDLIKRLRYSGG